ncbi:MAG TPA: RNA 2'-phosphotransferase, partial [Candidatus Binatus sp.]|nr:RNA 2'-phosphotransferase [Candidatus Binatus sp.]
HSFPVNLEAMATEPPAELYFGAARDLAQSMLHSGLTPRDRQYVHLSVSADEAESVAKRHDPSPSIIIIAARAAHDEGIQFYASGPLFLVEQVPAKFLSLR